MNMQRLSGAYGFSDALTIVGSVIFYNRFVKVFDYQLGQNCYLFFQDACSLGALDFQPRGFLSTAKLCGLIFYFCTNQYVDCFPLLSFHTENCCSIVSFLLHLCFIAAFVMNNVNNNSHSGYFLCFLLNLRCHFTPNITKFCWKFTERQLLQ